MMPFTVEQFFAVFRQYNEAVWPFQLVLAALGLAGTALVFGRRPAAGRIISAILAFLWAWMGVAYHWLYFTRINPAAWLFGGLFLLQATVFVWTGVVRGNLRFAVLAPAKSWAGGLLLLYAVVVYPLIGAMLGRAYMESPTFGLPCPTTIYTLGLLLFIVEPFPRWILAVPLLWAGVGSLAAFQLSVPQDFGLSAAGVLSLVVLFRRRPSGAGDLAPNLMERGSPRAWRRRRRYRL